MFCNGRVFIDGNQIIPGPEKEKKREEELKDWMMDGWVTKQLFVVGESDSPVECS